MWARSAVDGVVVDGWVDRKVVGDW